MLIIYHFAIQNQLSTSFFMNVVLDGNYTQVCEINRKIFYWRSLIHCLILICFSVLSINVIQSMKISCTIFKNNIRENIKCNWKYCNDTSYSIQKKCKINFSTEKQFFKCNFFFRHSLNLSEQCYKYYFDLIWWKNECFDAYNI